MTTEFYRTLLRVIEPVHQPDQSRFSGAARSHHSERFPHPQFKGHIIQRRSMPALVPECHAIKSHFWTDVRHWSIRNRIGFDNRYRLIQYPEHALCRRDRRHSLVIQIHQFTHRPEHLDPEHENDQQRTQLHIAVADPDSTYRKRDRGTRRHEQHRCSARRLIRSHHAHRAPVEIVDSSRQFFATLLALSERLQRRQSLHAVQEIRTQLTVRSPTSITALPIPSVEKRRHRQRC